MGVWRVNVVGRAEGRCSDAAVGLGEAFWRDVGTDCSNFDQLEMDVNLGRHATLSPANIVRRIHS